MNTTERQTIEWELTRLVNSFSHCIDKGRYGELAELFTEDGEFDRVGQVLRGRAEILQAMNNRHAFLTRHVIANLLFTRVDADAAEATMYVANFVGQTPAGDGPVAYALPQPAFLEFDDTYRRTPTGWRIAKRVARVVIKPEQTPDH